MNARRVLHAWVGTVLLLGLLLHACGIAGDHPLAELWKPVR